MSTIIVVDEGFDEDWIMKVLKKYIKLTIYYDNLLTMR